MSGAGTTASRPMRVLALLTDGIGGTGGIARYNCDFLSALAASSCVERVTALPRFGAVASALPANIRQAGATPGRALYSVRAIRSAFGDGPFDLIFCGHLFMAPLAALLARCLDIPLWLQVHGVDAWQRPRALVRNAAEHASLVTAVSRYTRKRFLEWANVDPNRVRVLPNTFRPHFAPRPKPPLLAERYGAQGRKVLLTVSRLSRRERYKGHDRVIAAMPAILERHPGALYIGVGDGDDRQRLERLAIEGGVAGAVRFAGAVADAELADHYDLADVFVMPSKGEGFGIVFLEAAAAGLPVIAGNRDGSVDALADGQIGRLVDPDDVQSLANAVIEALEHPSDSRTGAHRFAVENFRIHVDGLARSMVVGKYRAHRLGRELAPKNSLPTPT